MPTLAGLRRRGVPAVAVREFVQRVGVQARANSVVDVAMFEHSIREVLNKIAPRRMAVLRPLKLRIGNYPVGSGEELVAVNNPEDAAAGTRRIRFGRELYIERDDFQEFPPKGFYRLAPGREVRLRYAYFVTCHEVVKNAAGEVVELICTYDPETRGGDAPDGRKVRATLHWVAAAHATSAEIRLYNPLFKSAEPESDSDFIAELNPMSLETLTESLIEPALSEATPGEPVQFERQGYFCLDPMSASGRLIFNRTVGLRDGWTKARAIGDHAVSI
jgi:glutaminyl-tRNA synthetase